MSKLNIAVIGPGAMGLLISALLHKRANITLIDYRPERAEQMSKKGICMDGLKENIKFNLPVSCGLDITKDYDLVILCVKAYHTEKASKELKKAGYSGPLLTLQNGLGNVEILKNNLPGAEIIAGVTSEGATLVGIGHVRHAGKGKTALGRVIKNKPGNDFMKKIENLFVSSDIDVELVEDVEPLIWGKLLVNAGINALTAILGVQNGKLLEINSARDLMGKIVKEAWFVADKKGLILPYEDPIQRVEEVCRLTAANFSSMNQDIKNKRHTEIDFINSAVVREGGRIDVLCPYNDAVALLIKGLEEKIQS